MTEKRDDHDVAMQSRCIHCLGEHYCLAVIDISHGEAPCHNCGKFSRPMAWPDYVDALSKARERQAATQHQIPRPRFHQ